MKNLQRIKFLIVDDLDANLLALEGLLQRDGLELLKARSGSEALELLLIHEVALALIDVRMPEMNGFELAEIMRGHSRTRHVPIIFLTAGVVDQKKRIQGYETGAVDFLPKPIDPMSLRNKAAVFFDLARQRAELLESEARLLHSNELLEASNAELARTIGGLDRANREKDEFLAMLAHELRNPLAPVRNATEILQLCGTESPQGSGALKLIRHQVDNMSHLINDLLDVSRITQGKIQLKSQDVELAPMMKNAAALIQSACRAAKQELVINLPQYPTFLDADATRIEQCLGNLLSNASKYGGEGCRIEFTADVSASNPRQVLIRVSDNGAGIPAETLPHIFDLFVQETRNLDRSSGGLGIGLTIVQRLVELHGGTIEANSEGQGCGAEFVISLPTIEKPGPAPTDKPLFSGGCRSMRLLIVDDNVEAAKSMALYQSLHGHDTRISHDGLAALSVAAEFQPDVIILDIGLPGMDGYEVARELRLQPANQKALIIALTGYGSPDHRTRSMAVGFDHHMVKPADLALLQSWLATRK